MTTLRVFKSTVHGEGMFSVKKIASGETIAQVTGQLQFHDVQDYEDSISNPNWIGIGENFWIDPAQPFASINHSCNPNAGLVANDGAEIFLICMNDISEGDKITIDYSTTEAEPLWKMNCDCKSKNCRRIIGPVTTIPKNVFLSYLPYVQKYFQEFYQKNST